MIAAIDAETIDVAFPVGGGLYYSEENGSYQSNPVVSSAMELIYRGEFSENKTDSFAVNENNRMQYYYIRTNFPDAEVSFYPSIDDCLAAVRDGKVSGTTLNGLRASDILKNGKYRDLSQYHLSRNDDRCFGVRIGNEGLLKLLNRGINVLGADYAQNMSYRYTEGLYSFTFTDYLREHMALFGSVILAVAAAIIFLLVRDVRHSKREMQDKERARIELEAKNRELAEGRGRHHGDGFLRDLLVGQDVADADGTATLQVVLRPFQSVRLAVAGTLLDRGCPSFGGLRADRIALLPAVGRGIDDGVRAGVPVPQPPWLFRVGSGIVGRRVADGAGAESPWREDRATGTNPARAHHGRATRPPERRRHLAVAYP